MSPDSGEPSSEEEMTVTPQRADFLLKNLSRVRSSISSLAPPQKVRLIAVSKLHSPGSILALHSPSPSSSSSSPSDIQPQIHFGENYVQELSHKASILPRSIKWHFIGALQTNKCSVLAQIPNIYCVSSIDSIKKADALEKGRKGYLASSDATSEGRVNVKVQVNTSGEESKSGTSPGEETLALCRHIVEQCPNLKLSGLMTIGAIARSQASDDENEDFTALKREREAVLKEIDVEELELSMGMSADYEVAIKQGSSEVRVGTDIFGERPPRNGKKPDEPKSEVEEGAN